MKISGLIFSYILFLSVSLFASPNVGAGDNLVMDIKLSLSQTHSGLSFETNPELTDQTVKRVTQLMCNTRSGSTLCNKLLLKLQNQMGVELDLVSILKQQIVVFDSKQTLNLGFQASKKRIKVSVHLDQLSERSLIREFTQEFYRQIDPKNNFDNLVLIADYYRRQNIVMNSCSLFQTLINHRFKLRTDEVRSSKVANKVLNEIYYPEEISFWDSKLTCAQQLGSGLFSIHANDFKNSPSPGFASETISQCKIEPKIQTLEALRISESALFESVTGRSICDYLVDDELDLIEKGDFDDILKSQKAHLDEILRPKIDTGPKRERRPKIDTRIPETEPVI